MKFISFLSSIILITVLFIIVLAPPPPGAGKASVANAITAGRGVTSPSLPSPAAGPKEEGDDETLRTAAWVGEARRVTADFFTALATGNFSAAAASLHPAADQAHFRLLGRHLKSLQLLEIRAPVFLPDGESIFFPVILRAVVSPGAPAGWETGIATHYVLLRPANGRPRLAAIVEGP